MIDFASKYFSWHEVLHSEIAVRKGLDNTPDPATRATLEQTAMHMDRVREALSTPILVSSWYRAPKVNASVGGAKNSQHMKGEAVDFTSPKFGSQNDIFAFLKPQMTNLGIDQLIREFPDSATGGWVHVSFSDTPRRQALLIDSTGTKVV